jgi:hypothetical protein
VISRTTGLVVAAVLGVWSGGCEWTSGDGEGGASGGSTTAASTPPPDIRTSLDGMSVLPRHIPWTASVDVPADQIARVRFSVGPQTFWVDKAAPYSYGEPGAVLATAPLWDTAENDKRGRGLRFTVTAVTIDGKRWRETVVARVRKPTTWRDAPTYGIWGRRRMSVLTHPESARKDGPYTAMLHFSGLSLWVGRTVDRSFLYELTATRNRLKVGPQIFLGSHDQGVTLFGWSFNGYQCAPDGPPAAYSWSLTKERFGPYKERYLILKAEREPCRARQRILQGVWEGID